MFYSEETLANSTDGKSRLHHCVWNSLQFWCR
uniref:Uncharacterized protein n=1 Tax=Parascaris equorum TaxID=6256 RepID=A0A914SJV9_PAREQ